MNVLKNTVKILVLMLVTMLATSLVSAVNLQITDLEINGRSISVDAGNHTDNLKVNRGEYLDIDVWLKAIENVSNVQVEADIYGYRYAHREEDKVSATSRTFDLSKNDNDHVELSLQVPLKMDKKYTLLRIRVGDEDGTVLEQEYQLHVVGVSEGDAVIIKDVSLTPSNVVNAGRAFTAKVVVENIGNYDLNDVKVSFAIPQLNIVDTAYLYSLVADEREQLDQFLLRIPDCAEPGNYEVEVEAEFDEYESTRETLEIIVVEGDSCIDATGGTVITTPEAQSVSAGTEVSFPITIENQGSTARTYAVTVSGVEEWGTSRLSPGSQVVVAGGSTETIYVYVTAEATGEKVFMATVTSDSDSEAIPLTLSIVEEEADDLKSGLEVALIVLVVILILVGLIIGFKKLRDDNDEGAQTYY